MDETSLHQARALCCLLDGVVAQIQVDDHTDEDVKLTAFDIREDLRFFQEAVFWSEFRRKGQIPESTRTECLLLSADRNEQNAPSPSLRSLGKATEIKLDVPSPQYSYTLGDLRYGGLVGAGVASLHHVHHVLTSQIPANIPVHVIGELAGAACGGAVLTSVISAICNRLKTRRCI